MQELKALPSETRLYVVVMPTVASLLTVGSAGAVLLLEAGIFLTDRLPVRRVIGFREDRPMGLIDPIDIPATYVPVYGLTEADARTLAESHAAEIREAVQDAPAYHVAMGALAERLATDWRDVASVTERYRSALLDALETR